MATVKVAVIEDDLPTSKQLRGWIEAARPGIEVHQWFSRDEAEAALARERYALVVLDIELGRERHAGVALINAINKQRQGTPVLVVSAMPATIYRSIMKALDAWDYLQKTTFEEADFIDTFLEILRAGRDKADADRYLSIHRIAHGLGMKTNVTMLFGHIERLDERVDHMLRVRATQDESGGFQAFIPLTFHPDNNQMRKLPAPTAADTLRTMAVSRLMLDNVDHIKAFWIATGVSVAQAALWFGADDLDGTVQEERIYHMAGSDTPEIMTTSAIRRLISRAHREPHERDTLYNLVAG